MFESRDSGEGKKGVGEGVRRRQVTERQSEVVIGGGRGWRM